MASVFGGIEVCLDKPRPRAKIACVPRDSARDRLLAPVGRFPHLVIIQGFNAGRTYRLISGTTSIGRDPRCDVVLAYSTVSWHHASVTKRSDKIVLRDLGSRNGTFVGLDRVTRRELEAGDEIRFGDRVVLKLVFQEVARPS